MGQAVAFLWPKQPNHLVGIREKRYKFARYYDPSEEITGIAPEYEMYDLESDPYELNNIAFRGYRRTDEEQQQYDRLLNKLDDVIATRQMPLYLERKLNITVSSHRHGDNGGLAVKGVPVGSGNYREAWFDAGKDYYKAKEFSIWSDSGIIRGVAQGKAYQAFKGSSSSIKLQGTANITGGTGAYWKIKGTNLKFSQTLKTINIVGTVYY